MMKKTLYHCTHCHYSFLAGPKPFQCIDCGKFTVRQANPSEVWDWVRYAMEEKASDLNEALAYMDKLAS